MNHGLFENIVNNIQEDNFGNLWLSGLKGIYRISRQRLNEVAAGRRELVEALALGEADGMISSECNGGDNQPAGCKDKYGRIWFPTTRGVVVINPAKIEAEQVAPLAVIEQVVADNEIIYGDRLDRPRSDVQSPKSSGPDFQSKKQSPPGPALDVEPGILDNHLPAGRARALVFRYTANAFVAPEKVRFRYRLRGLDQVWRWDDQNSRSATYLNLRPGSYTFEMMASNRAGRWSEITAPFSFSLAPFLCNWPPARASCDSACATTAAASIQLGKTGAVGIGIFGSDWNKRADRSPSRAGPAGKPAWWRACRSAIQLKSLFGKSKEPT